MKDAWMTAEDIIEKFETDDADIRRYAMTHVSSAQQYEPLGDLRIWQDAPYEWGSKLLVTEYRWLEKIKTTRLYLKLPDRWFPLPIKAKENEVREYMQYFGIDSWEMVREFPYEDDVLQVCTICPQASRTAILAEGKHPIQCKSIGFFPFSYIREMGVKKGIMESMLDLNRTLNYRESKKDDIIASGAAGGLVVDKTKLGAEPQKVMEELKQNRTRPDFVLGVEGNIKDAIGGLPTSQVPNEIWQDIASLVDMFDRVSPVTPALEGRSTADESGIAFEMRHAVTKLSTLILYDSWQQHLMDKAEGWYNQAQITYKGIYRQVKNTDTGEIVEFNAPTYENGIKGYLNSIEDLPRSNIIVSLSKESPTEQFATRVRMYDLTKILSAHPELFQEEIQTLIYKIMQTEEMLPEERVEMNQMMNLKKLRNMLNLLSQTKGAEGQLLNNQTIVMQAQQMLQQMMQQQEQQMQAQQGQQAPQQISPETQMPQGSPAGPGPGEGPSAEMPLPGEAEGEPGQPVQTIRGEFNPGL